MKILIMGLPGTGKTTLALKLSKAIGAVHFNADEVRRNVNRGLGFSENDRVEHARRMGWLCDQVTKVRYHAVADFICPTRETRDAFGKHYLLIWMDTEQLSEYADTDLMFEPPDDADLVIRSKDVDEATAKILNLIEEIHHEIDR